MADREKLTELIGQCSCAYSPPCTGECGECHNVEMYDGEIASLADHLLANGVVVQRWIPVTERKPEDGETVLVYGGNGIYTAEFRRNGEYWWFHIMGRKNYKVTHWMPLPEPPKEEQK